MSEEEVGMIFKPHLESIKATIVNHTNLKDLESYIPEFCGITWMENIDDIDAFLESRKMTRMDMVKEMFERRTLPTALETVRLTFFLEGLDLTNVTHVIRHRSFSFSAQSSDPVSMAKHDILTNPAFDKNPELKKKAETLCLAANALYKDALEAGLSYYDARHYQPRAKEAKYFMSGNIKDFIMFINQRLGRMNQPTSDNILALRMRQEILKAYPDISKILQKQMLPEAVQKHYVGAINSKMNLNTFPPDELHQKYMDENGIKVKKSTKFSHPKPKDTYDTFKDFQKLFNKILKGKA